jgi:hypothetical protein
VTTRADKMLDRGDLDSAAHFSPEIEGGIEFVLLKEAIPAD